MTRPDLQLHMHGSRAGGLHGLTLIECVLAVAIVSTMLVAALLATGAVAKSKRVQKDQTTGMTLARQLMSEIVERNYTDPNGGSGFGPESGETRATFNDVDDYNGLHESPPQDSSGNALTAFTGWTRQTTVAYIDQGLLGTILNTDSGVKKITVVVTSPDGAVTTLCALRTSSSQYDKVQLVDRTYVGQSVVTIQVGSGTNSTIVSGVNPMNQAP